MVLLSDIGANVMYTKSKIYCVTENDDKVTNSIL